MWAESRGLKGTFEEVVHTPEFKKTLLEDLSATSDAGGLKGFEKIVDLHVEPLPFTISNDLLTPTFKVKRDKAKVIRSVLFDDVIFLTTPCRKSISSRYRTCMPRRERQRHELPKPVFAVLWTSKQNKSLQKQRLVVGFNSFRYCYMSSVPEACTLEVAGYALLLWYHLYA